VAAICAQSDETETGTTITLFLIIINVPQNDKFWTYIFYPGTRDLEVSNLRRVQWNVAIQSFFDKAMTAV
jgi:hypothetical protein